MKDWRNENASQRKSFVGVIYNRGEKLVKSEILNNLPNNLGDFHTKGYLHLHDLEAYYLTYNCLTFDILKSFPYERYSKLKVSRKIMKVFDYLKDIVTKIGNEQSGGMGFPNFDIEIAEILTNLDIPLTDQTKELIRDQINGFIFWCNDGHERMGEVAYYVSLNIGLADTVFSRFIAYTVIDEFYHSPVTNIKPNIIFKVNSSYNSTPESPNYDLYQYAIKCTVKKMIPTYLLTECQSNKNYDPHTLTIMGCRTRVVDNIFSEPNGIGRGNIVNLTMNLPRLALEVDRDSKGLSIQQKFEEVFSKWKEVAESGKDILLHRFNSLCLLSKEDFPSHLENDLFNVTFKDAENLFEVFKHGTLSIGFIGLSEMVEVISGEPYYHSKELYQYAKDFVGKMRNYTDNLKKRYNLNFSLLATSGEFISGRFPEIDKKEFNHKILDKDFYTNSFHVNVDSDLSAFDKIFYEGFFHNLANGGCITYVEFDSAPIGNEEAIDELIKHAEASGVHYLGFNYPLDICKKCNEKGVFDICPNCGSKDILRIRRVSGYLEILDYFTDGKKAEVKARRAN